jgi:hypothetical protein
VSVALIKQPLTELQVLSHDSFHISTGHISNSTQVYNPIVPADIGTFRGMPFIAVNMPTFFLIEPGKHIAANESLMAGY